jgi:protein SCO1
MMSRREGAALATFAALALVTAAVVAGGRWASALASAGDDGAAASPMVSAPGGSPTPSVADALGDPAPTPELAGLVLPDGTTFDLADLRGQPTLVYFGYTHCPDVCPATMGVLFGVFEQEPQTQAVFVSIDPERDTPEFLGEWTAYLPENLYAITGTPAAIRRAADGWGVRYARVESTSAEGYAMSHTADLYLLDDGGRLVATYPFGTTSAQIVDDLRQLPPA